MRIKLINFLLCKENRLISLTILYCKKKFTYVIFEIQSIILYHILARFLIKLNVHNFERSIKRYIVFYAVSFNLLISINMCVVSKQASYY